MLNDRAHPSEVSVAHAHSARNLALLYLTRTVVSAAWVASFALLPHSDDQLNSPATQTWVWFVLYPVIDAVATVIDIRTTPHASRTIAQPLNLIASLAATTVFIATATRGFTDAIDAFGVWAIVSGAIQLLVALRRSRQITGQWLMIISGAGSVFAGTTFLTWSGSVDDGLSGLLQYSTGGAVWYLVAGIWMFIGATRTFTAAAAGAGARTSLRLETERNV